MCDDKRVLDDFVVIHMVGVVSDLTSAAFIFGLTRGVIRGKFRRNDCRINCVGVPSLISLSILPSSSTYEGKISNGENVVPSLILRHRSRSERRRMYKFCNAMAPPPPIKRSISPPGLSLTVSYNSSNDLSSSAGDNFRRSFGESRN